MPVNSETRALLAIAPGVLLVGVAGGIAFPILPLVGVQAGLPLPFIGVILAANRAARVVSSPIVGALTDRIGGRRTLIAGMLLQIAVMLCYTLGIVTKHPGVFFLLGRVVHGPGSACVFIAAQALALHAGGRIHGGRSAATIRVAMSLGVPLGLVAGGILSDRCGNVVTFVAALLGVLLATLVATWLTPDLRVVQPERSSGWSVLRALADRRLLALGALNFAVAFSAQGMVLTTLVLLVRARQISLFALRNQGTSGLLMGVLVVTSALVMPLAGRMGDRFRLHTLIAVCGLVLMVPSLVIMGLTTAALGLVGGLALMGLGVGAMSPALLALVGNSVSESYRGRAVGVLQLCGDFGGMLGPLVGTTLLTTSLRAPYLGTAVLLVVFIPIAIRLLVRRNESTAV